MRARGSPTRSPRPSGSPARWPRPNAPPATARADAERAITVARAEADRRVADAQHQSEQALERAAAAIATAQAAQPQVDKNTAEGEAKTTARLLAQDERECDRLRHDADTQRERAAVAEAAARTAARPTAAGEPE